MGLENNTAKSLYVNISKGKLVTKINGEQILYDSLTATIKNVEFAIEEFNAKQFEVVRVTLQDSDMTYLLKIRTDSGYFRGFINCLKMANISQPIVFIPNSKEDNGKTKTTIFLKQNNKSLKHAFTKDNMGDLPPVEKVVVNGIEQWDNTKQLSYWKNWIKGIKWQTIDENSNKHIAIDSNVTKKENDDFTYTDDDLPF